MAVRYGWRIGLALGALAASCSVDLAPLQQADASLGGSGGVAGAPTGGAGASDASLGGSGGQPSNPIPASCAEAATARSSFGCEFWPTVTPNLVWSVFDFAVVVTNPQSSSVDVSVTSAAFSAKATLAAKSAQIIYLPWVNSLKGPEVDACGGVAQGGPSIRADGAAYRLTSTLPVGVTQHSPIEPKPQGGPSGKNWSSCPGYKCNLGPKDCSAASTDSSLLLPTTSLGTSYRVVGSAGWSDANLGAYAVLTATSDATQVSVKLSATATLLAGGGISAQGPGSTVQATLNAADVLVLQTGSKSDLSGSLVSADKPLQVISGMACAEVPVGKRACDHLEETLPPASALGMKYVVSVPLGPKNNTPGHLVRLVGHVDGTQLSYPDGSPQNAPASLSAGQLSDLGLVKQDFVVEGDKPFAVMSFIPGSEVLYGATAEDQLGDPALRQVVPVSQYRKAYSVAAPPDYGSSHFELIVPVGASVSMDGTPISGTAKTIGTSGYEVRIVPSGAATAVLHTLTSDQPFGVQVVGFDRYTSYAHAGGMNVGSSP